MGTLDREEIVATGAANRDVAAAKAVARQDCRDIVHISIFFDGTGNNKDKDTGTMSWSNVARLYEAAIDEPDAAMYRIYLSGVGTEYNGTADGWLAQSGVWVEDTLGGLTFGAGGDRRMDFCEVTVNNRLRDVLISNAAKLGGEVAKYAAENSDKSFDEVNRALSKHRLIKVINVSVFGFSRGAALARAFTNRLADDCTRSEGKLFYDGYELRFVFLGLFDTVASFGWPAQNMRTPFSERELRVPRVVERCVHLVAGHEIRFSFPVDLIRLNGELGGDWFETTYPGVHSDVGGGYQPVEQNIDNNFGRIPMRDMMRDAVAHGARMIGYERVRSELPMLFKKRFECRKDTEEAYRAYMLVYGSASGSIEDQVKRHMKLLYGAYGTMHRQGMQNAGDLRRSQSWWRRIGPQGMAAEVKKYRDALATRDRRFAMARELEKNLLAGSAAGWMRIGGHRANSYAQYVKIQDWQLEAWDANAPSGVVDFVARYVHDSKVDFIMNKEPFSYFKMRGIEESTASVWQDATAWVQVKRAEATEAVQSGVAAGKAKVEHAADVVTTTVQDTAREAADTAREAAEAVQRRAVQARDYAQQKMQAAMGAARETAGQVAAQARQTAGQVSQAASDAYSAASRQAQQAARAAAERIRAARASADRMVESGTTWVRDTFNDWFGEGKPNQ